MSPINRSEPSQSEAEGRWEEKNVLCDQIKEIIAALNDIHSQLTEQNKYLDVLTETDWSDYVEFAREERPEETREQEEDAEYFETKEEFLQEEENHEEILAESREGDTRDTHDIETAPAREQLEETVLVDKTKGVQKKNHHLFESTSPVSSTFYLPLGLVITLFCMRIFNAKQSAHGLQASSTTIFIILSLAAYIFATFTLWFLREEDWVKRVIGSWNWRTQTQVRIGRIRIKDRDSRICCQRTRALETS